MKLLILLTFFATLANAKMISSFFDNVINVIKKSPQILFMSDFQIQEQNFAFENLLFTYGVTTIGIQGDSMIVKADCDTKMSNDNKKFPYLIIIWIEDESLFKKSLEMINATAKICAQHAIYGMFVPQNSMIFDSTC